LVLLMRPTISAADAGALAKASESAATAQDKIASFLVTDSLPGA
jgi:hypothetical protein